MGKILAHPTFPGYEYRFLFQKHQGPDLLLQLSVRGLSKAAGCLYLQESDGIGAAGRCVRHRTPAHGYDCGVGTACEKEYAPESGEKRRTLDRQITQVKQEQARSQNLLDGLYQNMADGMLTREEYLSMKGHYQKRFDDATLRLDDLNSQLQQLERYGPSNPMFAVCRTAAAPGLSSVPAPMPPARSRMRPPGPWASSWHR